ncbi:GEVED domain-containing protein [Formosa algae]|uniref:Uncharacterized protein n=1 Tax=Formosa algae TaxID=225843 RepID=A0A9X0YJB3_9FLAO|nr:GEVED domain-containing protein [Formosa algae]MBP1838124.1 hypothetical protein [Formosa algae]MDQ0334259.1 hypothetical protein [Formosa algae]OEI80093.1 hypothetical protein AST99_11095 [Formosa algae]
MIQRTTHSALKRTRPFKTSFFKQFTLVLCFALIGVSGFGQTVVNLSSPGTGTYEIPCGVTKIDIEVWGSGGAGGGSTIRNAGGNGGDAGKYSSSSNISVAEGEILNYTIAAGGAGTTGGNNHGDQSFIQAQGPTSYDWIGANGGNGGDKANNNSDTADDGTDAPNDNNGISIGDGGLANSNGDGYAGGPGAGGGGGTRRGNNNATGGDGGDGYIRITMYGDSGSSSYCTTSFTSVEPITNVTFAGINNATDETINGSQGVETFCDISGTVTQGETYEITVKGNTNGNNKNFFMAFIDWNQDGVFDDDEDAYEEQKIGDFRNSTGVDSNSVTGNIIVPDDAILGTTLIRIIKTEGSSATDACSTFDEGQAEDYTLTVEESVDEIDDCGYTVIDCDIAFDDVAPISHVTFAGIDNTTDASINGSDAIERFCDLEANVNLGSTYEITLEGNTNGDDKSFFVAYIDWNQDNVFDEDDEELKLGELPNSNGSDGISLTVDIVIPDDATLGRTTMRIIKTNDNSATEPCDNFNEGQAEEYTLIIDEVTCTKTWVGDNGIGWFVPSNWYPKGVPTAESCVFINTLDGNSNPKVKGVDTSGDINGIAYAKSITISGDNSQLTLSNEAELQVTEYIISNSPIYITDESSLIMEDGYLESSANGTIEGDSFFSVEDFTLTSSDASWDVNDTSILVIEDKLALDGEMTLNDNASLIQTNNDTNSSTGTFTVNRSSTTTLNTDYTYWSSPVQNYNIDAISSTSHRYEWLPSIDDEYGNWSLVSNTVMTPGKGYIIRGNNYTASFQYDKPNNGPISINLTRGTYNGSNYTDASSTIITKEDDNWNLIGNPYPSAIYADTFLTDSDDIIEGGIRIWTHASEISSGNDDPFYADQAESYNPDDYITYTLAGSAPSGFDGYIASGQGFFVLMQESASSPSQATFTNAMRTYASTYTNSDFYRTSGEKNRIWLNLIDTENIAHSMLIGYFDDALDSKDALYDAIIKDFNNTAIYSIINDEAFIIQGKANPFEDTDLVPLGIVSLKKDEFTIGIEKLDGVFGNTDQAIYLEDLYENTIHNLRDSPYEFTSEIGTFNDRFILRYQDSTLSIDDVIADTDLKIIATQNFIKASTTTSTINKIIVYDIIGRVLYQANSLNATEIKLDQLAPTQSPLIVKATLSNGTTKIQKVIY